MTLIFIILIKTKWILLLNILLSMVSIVKLLLSTFKFRILVYHMKTLLKLRVLLVVLVKWKFKIQIWDL
jgi:hypothetical protein